MFLHKPLQHCQLKGHLIPHNPQLFLSELTFTQRFQQHKLLRGNSPSRHTHGLLPQPEPPPLTLFFTHAEVLDGTLVEPFWYKMFGADFPSIGIKTNKIRNVAIAKKIMDIIFILKV